MNILVVHEVSYRKKVVYEYQDFAERLASLGHNVTVVDYDDTGDHAYQKAEISRTGLGRVTLENTPYLNIPVLKYLTGRQNYKRILRRKLENKEVDVVFLYSVFINGTNTLRLCKRFGVPVVYRVLDVYHKLRQNKLIELPLFYGERFIYRRADVVCLTNDRMAPYVRETAGKDYTPRLEVVHHGVDTSHFRPLPRNERLAQTYGITPEDRVALYLGTTYSFSGLDTLAEHLADLRRYSPRAKLMIVGGGELDERLRALVKERGLERDVILAGFQPYEALPDLLSLATVCVNPFAINEITSNIVPIKLLQYLACGRATLSSPLPDVVRLFPERRSGILYESLDNRDHYFKRLGQLLEAEDERRELAGNGLSFIRQNYAVERQIKKLSSLLEASCAKS